MSVQTASLAVARWRPSGDTPPRWKGPPACGFRAVAVPRDLVFRLRPSQLTSGFIGLDVNVAEYGRSYEMLLNDRSRADVRLVVVRHAPAPGDGGMRSISNIPRVANPKVS
jgi:hypothetical protein